MANNPISPTAARAAVLVTRETMARESITPDLLHEIALSVYVDGSFSRKMVCTPTDLNALVLGNLLTEGVISHRSQVRSITIDEAALTATVELQEGAAEDFPAGDFSWTAEEVFRLADAFRELTPVYRKTRGIHSCLLMHEGELRFCCEDIGRHNALDKVIGYALAEGLDLGQCILYSSGRIPDDMITKAIRSGVPLLVSKATPTAKAVDLARRHRINLICAAHPDSFKIFSAPEFWDLPVSAGILAGGKSSRMGRDKVLLDSCGQPFWAHLQAQCAFAPEILLSVGSPEQIPGADIPCVVDEQQDFGPLEGIYQLLNAAQNPWLLAVAADMQCLSREFLQRFLAQLRPEDKCMILKSPGGLEPLCAVYGKAVLPILAQMRQEGIRKPRALFDRVQTHYVTAADLGLTEDRLSYYVCNINTPEDYRNYLNQQGR